MNIFQMFSTIHMHLNFAEELLCRLLLPAFNLKYLHVAC